MAISVNTVFEIRDSGNDANGGGFVAGASGADYSQQDAAQKAGTDLAIHATTNTDVLPTAAGVAATDVGNIIQIASGTDWTAGFYEIKSIQGSYWRLDRSPSAVGNVNTATYKMGGALGSPGMLGATGSPSGISAWIEGSFTLSTATPNVSGGPLQPAFIWKKLEGYVTTRGDGEQAVISAGAVTNVTMIDTPVISRSSMTLNITLDGNSGSGNNGFAMYTEHWCFNCIAHDFDGSASNTGFSDLGVAIKCYAYNCGIGFATAVDSVATACATGFTGAACRRCVAYVNTGNGFTGNGNNFTIENCVAYANGGSGFVSSNRMLYQNCVSYGHAAGYGFDISTDTRMINCAAGNNASGHTDVTPGVNIGFVELTADPFTSSTDFRPNNEGGGGALLRAAGIGVYGQTDNRDIGAVQHADPTIVVPDAKYIYGGQTVTSDGTALVTGTLQASTIAAAKGSGSNLSAGILKKDEVVDDVTGTYEGAGGGGASPVFGDRTGGIR